MGAGANARHSIGTGIIGGMIGETTLAMLYVPLLFYLFDRMRNRHESKEDAHRIGISPAGHDAIGTSAPEEPVPAKGMP
jgi:multidrug efflux pump